MAALTGNPDVATTTRRLSPRNTELALLLLAVALGAYAYVQAGLGASGVVPDDAVRHVSILAGLALAVHLVLRWRAPWADPLLLPIATALNGIGLAMIARIDVALLARGAQTAHAPRQLLWTILGVGAACAVLFGIRDHRVLRRYTYTAMVAGLVLLLLPLVPGLGLTVNGARIWVRIGSFATFQPAELAKIALAVFFAGYLVTHRDTLSLAGRKVLGMQLPRLRDLGPIVLAWVVSIGVLVLQRDLGTSLLIFGLFVAMLYVATERMSWVLIGLVLFAGGAAAAATVFGHVGARFEVWLRALDDDIYQRAPGGSGQVVSGLFGMAGGGLTGTGWGQGYPYLVPYANSDFIVASLGEELGLAGLLAILLCYLLLAQRGLRASASLRDGFGTLLAVGLAFSMAFQVFVVVGGVTRVIPLTGLTAPFLAQGGSSLVSAWIVLALLLRMSDAAHRPDSAPDLNAPVPGAPAPGASGPGVPGFDGPRLDAAESSGSAPPTAEPA